MGKATVKDRLLASLNTSTETVFMRSEFDGLGGCRQVARAIREISEAGVLVRVGYGVYAKARFSKISGKPVPTDSLLTIGLEAMRKMGVKADVGKDARALREGKSSQVPMLPAISVGSSRVRRKIGFGNRQIEYEAD